MIFTYNGKLIDVACKAGDTVKLYAVPETYSTDGLYAAVWRQGEVEPAPACLGSETRLLAHVAIQQEDEQLTVSGHMAQGVSHA